KRRSADGSVGSPHVRVGNCQALNTVETPSERWGFLRFKGYPMDFKMHRGGKGVNPRGHSERCDRDECVPPTKRQLER
uniref:hypothetical protein n=1 Tax=Photorhabdus bodei TaxID=2029681 RepID=UPI001E304686